MQAPPQQQRQLQAGSFSAVWHGVDAGGAVQTIAAAAAAKGKHQAEGGAPAPAARFKRVRREPTAFVAGPAHHTMRGDDDYGAGSASGGSSRKREAVRASPLAPSKRRKAFSAQEENNLKRGVTQFGVGQWAAILSHYKFADGRTNVSLKDKWRTITKQQNQ